MFSTPHVIAAGAAVAIVAALFAWIYQQGSVAVKISNERQNNAAGDKADRARSAYDLCVDSGRVYDFGAGKCVGPSPGRRH